MIDSHSLWRCRNCKHAIYEVLSVDDGMVYYRHYRQDNDSEYVKLMALWELYFEPLSPDEVLEETGGIY